MNDDLYLFSNEIVEPGEYLLIYDSGHSNLINIVWYKNVLMQKVTKSECDIIYVENAEDDHEDYKYDFYPNFDYEVLFFGPIHKVKHSKLEFIKNNVTVHNIIT